MLLFSQICAKKLLLNGVSKVEVEGLWFGVMLGCQRMLEIELEVWCEQLSVSFFRDLFVGIFYKLLDLASSLNIANVCAPFHFASIPLSLFFSIRWALLRTCYRFVFSWTPHDDSYDYKNFVLEIYSK